MTNDTSPAPVVIELLDEVNHDEPLYLRSYDPDGHDGYGKAVWTNELELAKRFPTVFAAAEEWRRQSTVRPLRPDGQPNRPLSAHTVTFVRPEQ